MRYRFQLQPSRWSCLPTSLAIVLDVPVQAIFDIVGHDGSEIVWPELKEPQCRKGFTLGEMIHTADRFGRNLVAHQKQWVHSPDGNITITIEPPEDYFRDKLERFDGVITGVTTQGKRHAVAWVKGQVIDPTTSFIYPYFHGQEEFFLACCP